MLWSAMLHSRPLRAASGAKDGVRCDFSRIKCRESRLSQHSMQLDTIDLRILSELQQDGSLTNVELARRVHLSPSPCLARVKALEASGVSERYVALASA